ncbi:MAG: Wzt carbohydrate-binding domain-containing protein, partial [Candidatus Omnitrophota bacterium]
RLGFTVTLKQKSMTILPTKQAHSDIGQKLAMRLNRIGKKYPFIQTHALLKNEDFWALKNISCEIQQGQICGVIGRNGAGKSTLLNILAGVLTATEGKLEAQGKIVGLFQLGIGFQDEMTGEENIFLNAALLGATRKHIEDRLKNIVKFSELGSFIQMPLGSYSQGMRLRLAFSILIHLDFDILILDEILMVGDALFQHKCLQCLLEFKRCGKTMLVSSQQLELAERLCDQVLLLDHGRLLFSGPPQEGILRYQALLNEEKFFVGPASGSLVQNTKKWSQDRGDWGKSLGTKEAAISAVSFRQGKSRLKIKAAFSAQSKICDPHFGVAIFREDGVYCYGPNTGFEDIMIPQINPGKGWFVIEFKNMVLAPGSYRVSVAIWDKKETLPYDYRNGFYSLGVPGRACPLGALLNLSYRTQPRLFFPRTPWLTQAPPLKDLLDTPSGTKKGGPLSLDLLNADMKKTECFITNQDLNIQIRHKSGERCPKYLRLRFGLFRDDGIFCQEFPMPDFRGGRIAVLWPRCPLLPGGYKIVAALWDLHARRFVENSVLNHSFRMVFNRQDHGTTYLPHHWSWQLPLSP